MSRRSEHRPPWSLCCLLAVEIGLMCTVCAQELEFSATPAPVGSGARAAGMADAFTAVADDATAASWNPAGLVQLERPEIALAGDWLHIEDDLDWFGRGSAEHEFNDAHSRLNFLSITYPFPRLLLGKRVVGSLSYQRRFDFDRELVLDVHGLQASPGGLAIHTRNRLDFVQRGKLATLSAAFAVELSPAWSVGAAVNFWRDTPLNDNGWSQALESTTWTRVAAATAYERAISRSRYEDVTGENFTLGILWEPGPRWRVGLRYESKVDLDADYHAITLRSQTLFPGTIQAASISVSPAVIEVEERTLRIPESWAAGLAYRATPRLTLALDAVRKEWDDFYVKDSGRRYSLIDGSDLSSPYTRPRIDPTWTVRFGAEYVFLPRASEDTLRHLWSLRGGVFYDEEPATGRSSVRSAFERGDGEPDTFWGLAFGVGYQANRWLNFDLGYQYRWGDGVNRDFVRNVREFEESVTQHRIVASCVLYF